MDKALKLADLKEFEKMLSVGYLSAVKQAIDMLCQQQAKIEALKQVLQSIANEHVELSHDKIKWQCDDHIRWAKEALK